MKGKYENLEGYAKYRKRASLFLALAIFFFFMALMCIPRALYNNPVASQSIFSLVRFQPMFKYVFLVFSGFFVTFIIFAGILYDKAQHYKNLIGGISPEDRVRLADEKEKS